MKSGFLLLIYQYLHIFWGYSLHIINILNGNAWFSTKIEDKVFIFLHFRPFHSKCSQSIGRIHILFSIKYIDGKKRKEIYRKLIKRHIKWINRPNLWTTTQKCVKVAHLPFTCITRFVRFEPIFYLDIFRKTINKQPCKTLWLSVQR